MTDKHMTTGDWDDLKARAINMFPHDLFTKESTGHDGEHLFIKLSGLDCREILNAAIYTRYNAVIKGYKRVSKAMGDDKWVNHVKGHAGEAAYSIKTNLRHNKIITNKDDGWDFKHPVDGKVDVKCYGRFMDEYYIKECNVLGDSAVFSIWVLKWPVVYYIGDISVHDVINCKRIVGLFGDNEVHYLVPKGELMESASWV